MKRWGAVLTTILLIVLCLNLSVAAATPSIAEPLWDNTARLSGNIDFDDTVGIAHMRATGKTGVTQINGSVVVYKLVGSEWVYVAQDSKSVNTLSCYLEIEFTAEVGYEYKAEFTFVVYKNGIGETVQSTLTKVCE